MDTGWSMFSSRTPLRSIPWNNFYREKSERGADAKEPPHTYLLWSFPIRERHFSRRSLALLPILTLQLFATPPLFHWIKNHAADLPKGNSKTLNSEEKPKFQVFCALFDLSWNLYIDLFRSKCNEAASFFCDRKFHDYKVSFQNRFPHFCTLSASLRISKSRL